MTAEFRGAHVLSNTSNTQACEKDALSYGNDVHGSTGGQASAARQAKVPDEHAVNWASFSARFWKRVSKTDGCWLWVGAKQARGYGVVRINRCRLLTHRVSWRIAFGAWPTTGLRHSCDNPSCVNPAHLSLGTQAENMADMARRGRSRIGERQSVLTEAQARELRAEALAGAPYRELMERYGVAHSTVTNIKFGRRWRHLWRTP